MRCGRRITGQDEAVDAMADAVCIAKARLNDPGRPLATLALPRSHRRRQNAMRQGRLPNISSATKNGCCAST